MRGPTQGLIIVIVDVGIDNVDRVFNVDWVRGRHLMRGEVAVFTCLTSEKIRSRY